MSDVQIPESLESISLAWLQSVLHRRFPNAQLQSFALEDASSGTTGRARLSLVWDSNEAPASVFVKLPPSDPTQRAFVVETGMGRKEALFYQQLAAEVPLRVPDSYYAAAKV